MLGIICESLFRPKNQTRDGFCEKNTLYLSLQIKHFIVGLFFYSCFTPIQAELPKTSNLELPFSKIETKSIKFFKLPTKIPSLGHERIIRQTIYGSLYGL
jgi:hypothetical protein